MPFVTVKDYLICKDFHYCKESHFIMKILDWLSKKFFALFFHKMESNINNKRIINNNNNIIIVANKNYIITRLVLNKIVIV